jgi:hydroxypyruvate reductase
MMAGNLAEMRKEAERMFLAAVKRVDPYEAVRAFVRLQGRRIIVGSEGGAEVELDMDRFQRIFLVGGGKATAPMARAMETILEKEVHAGLINVKYGFSEALSYTEIIEADHPLPDQNGVIGTRTILDLLEKADDKDLIFSLISGGGSALLPLPAGRIRLEEKQVLTQRLLDCGASIDEINAIRKHVSGSKGGQMARAAYPATTVNLMLSDVVGDRMDVIASGPFVPDQSTFSEAWSIIERYGIESEIPETVREHLKAGVKEAVEETPKSGDPVFDRVHNVIIGSNILALEAAAAAAAETGYQPLILSSMVEGETRDVALVHAAVAQEILKTGRPTAAPACIISGGETTVTIHGDGLGGRNQEFCLAAALELADLPPRVVVLSGGTDGNDGPTDAAGAVVDPLTVKRGRDMGLEAGRFLQNNDAYHFFEKTGDLLKTGPTKTNVMDVRILLVK